MEEKIIEQLNRIERYSIISAKSVLTLDEVAIVTGLSKSWLYKATCSNTIPHYKPNGKLVYFDKKEIEEYLSAALSAAQELGEALVEE